VRFGHTARVGVLRLRGCFALRSSHSAEDDKRESAGVVQTCRDTVNRGAQRVVHAVCVFT